MAVNRIPTPRSRPQILGQMIDSMTSRAGISRLKVGAPVLSALEAASQSDVRTAQDVFNFLKSSDLDNSEGIALDRRGIQEGCPRFKATKGVGTVTIGDISFNKISAKIFQGLFAPIVGSVILNVDDTQSFPSSGAIYIGRGTPNVEGSISYTSKINNGSYWTLNLASPTTKFHNLGESVVLAQGGSRLIDSGTLTSTTQTALNPAIQFATVFDVELADGETQLLNVQVVASVAGASGGVSAGSIKDFPGGVPFPGATVINNLPFVARDPETDNDYRLRIRKVSNSRQRGTDLAIENAVLGATSPDENKQVTSSSLVRIPHAPSVLYIDDGTGYEEISEGIGQEIIVDSAAGGENIFKTIHRPVAKAFVASTNLAPFILADSQQLSVDVGGTIYSHFFDTSEFVNISSASAYEVVASINRNPAIGFSARTANAGSLVILFGRAEENEDLEVLDAGEQDANQSFLFSTAHRFSTLLYKNDQLLNKDGIQAKISSYPFVQWNNFSGSQTLTIGIDLTSVITYTFTDQDFIDADDGYVSVAKNSMAAWVNVINRKVPGILAVIEIDRIILTSNRGRSSSARIRTTGGTLVTNFVFPVADELGEDSDYTIDRGTGDTVLANVLATGDRLTLGSQWTRGFLESSSIAPTNISVERTMWWSVDSNPSIISHGVGAATELTGSVSSSTNSGFIVEIEADTPGDAFTNAQLGDSLILNDSDTDLPSAIRNAWGVTDTAANIIRFEKRGMSVPRGGFRAVPLVPISSNPSRVLAIGGYIQDSLEHGVSTNSNTMSRDGSGLTDTCEIWDPATGAWSYTDSMASPRAHHTATTLLTGKVLVAGGYGPDGIPLDTTEIWDPATGLWTAGPAMADGRAWHSATLLASGRVLIAGGYDGGGALATTEEFNPGTNLFINPGTLNVARFSHAAIKLPVGAGTAGGEGNNVLVVGGMGTPSVKLLSAERYSISAFTWTAKASMATTRAMMGIEVLDTTRYIIVVGDGESNVGGTQNTYTVYDTNANTWSAPATFTGNFYHEQNPLIKCNTSGHVLALYGITRGSPAALAGRRIVYAGGTPTVPTITNITQPKFALAGVQKCGVQLVNLTNLTDTVLCVGGVSVENLDNSRSGLTTANHEMLDAALDAP